jgi:N-terminal acetyltransferase B complex catalytic subunit
VTIALPLKLAVQFGYSECETLCCSYRLLDGVHLLAAQEAVLKHTYFVDLFVRASNSLAIQMYTQLGYVIYRTVLGYYNGEIPKDAYDMRKSLPRDVDKEAMIPLPHPVLPQDLEW